jgi:hypothetical protein
LFIHFNEYELLELFENEPVIIGDKEAGMYIYSKTDSFGFKLVLTFSIYENECLLSLNHESYTIPIVDLKMQDVTQISSSGNRLMIHRENCEKDLEVVFKPNFSIVNFSEC